MKRLPSVLASALAMALFTGLSARPAQASAFDKLTYFTFGQPVEIPGAVLPAGTYVFKLADPGSSHSVVQVLSQDGKKVYASFFALPDTRFNPSDGPIVTFREASAGSAEAVKSWFYPGEATGFEFVYPKSPTGR